MLRGEGDGRDGPPEEVRKRSVIRDGTHNLRMRQQIQIQDNVMHH